MYLLPHKITRYGLHQVDVPAQVPLIEAWDAIHREYDVDLFEVFRVGPTNCKEDCGYKIYFKGLRKEN
jgi:hypothetical protein